MEISNKQREDTKDNDIIKCDYCGFSVGQDYLYCLQCGCSTYRGDMVHSVNKMTITFIKELLGRSIEFESYVSGTYPIQTRSAHINYNEIGEAETKIRGNFMIVMKLIEAQIIYNFTITDSVYIKKYSNDNKFIENYIYGNCDIDFKKIFDIVSN